MKGIAHCRTLAALIMLINLVLFPGKSWSTDKTYKSQREVHFTHIYRPHPRCHRRIRLIWIDKLRMAQTFLLLVLLSGERKCNIEETSRHRLRQLYGSNGTEKCRSCNRWVMKWTAVYFTEKKGCHLNLVIQRRTMVQYFILQWLILSCAGNIDHILADLLRQKTSEWHMLNYFSSISDKTSGCNRNGFNTVSMGVFPVSSCSDSPATSWQFWQKQSKSH